MWSRLPLLSCAPIKAASLTLTQLPTALHPLPSGTFNPNPAGNSRASCRDAPRGSYVPSAASDEALPCAAGTFQDVVGQRTCKVSIRACVHQCFSRQRRLWNLHRLASVEQCVTCRPYKLSKPHPHVPTPAAQPCPAGSYCPAGAAAPIQCKAGYVAGPRANSCVACTSGTYQVSTACTALCAAALPVAGLAHSPPPASGPHSSLPSLLTLPCTSPSPPAAQGRPVQLRALPCGRLLPRRRAGRHHAVPCWHGARTGRRRLHQGLQHMPRQLVLRRRRLPEVLGLHCRPVDQQAHRPDQVLAHQPESAHCPQVSTAHCPQVSVSAPAAPASLSVPSVPVHPPTPTHCPCTTHCMTTLCALFIHSLPLFPPCSHAPLFPPRCTVPPSLLAPYSTLHATCST